jgi:hypothetical protein
MNEQDKAIYQAAIDDAWSENTHTELAIGLLRYEALRSLQPRQHAELHRRNLAGERFDDMIDALVVERAKGTPSSSKECRVPSTDPAPRKPTRYQTERSRCPHCGGVIEPVPIDLPPEWADRLDACVGCPECQSAVELRIVEVPE